VSFVIHKVYTRSGDTGTTRLVGGQERKKTDLRVEAYGTIDELNAALGLAVESTRVAPSRDALSNDSNELGSREELGRCLRRVQNELFDLGGEVATLPDDIHEKQVLVGDADIERLESEMDALTKAVPPLHSFVLPGGGMTSAYLHLARTVCRRAERRMLACHDVEPLRAEVLRYLNRLSDWLFVMGRRAVLLDGQAEVLWRPGARDSL
jgi:cob(I)alamin adenosyltransferase